MLVREMARAHGSYVAYFQEHYKVPREEAIRRACETVWTDEEKLRRLDEQPADKQPPNRPKSRQQMIHEVTARPLVRQALELFDAEVTRVDESRGHLGSGEGEEGSR